jgi:ferredoxin
MKLHVTVDHDKCCGAGQCVRVAPEVFDQSDEGIVKLLDASPPAELHRAVREAAILCPGVAITITAGNSAEVDATHF